MLMKIIFSVIATHSVAEGKILHNITLFKNAMKQYASTVMLNHSCFNN